jgi:hypothetical protein
MSVDSSGSGYLERFLCIETLFQRKRNSHNLPNIPNIIRNLQTHSFDDPHPLLVSLSIPSKRSQGPNPLNTNNNSFKLTRTLFHHLLGLS